MWRTGHPNRDIRALLAFKKQICTCLKPLISLSLSLPHRARRDDEGDSVVERHGAGGERRGVARGGQRLLPQRCRQLGPCREERWCVNSGNARCCGRSSGRVRARVLDGAAAAAAAAAVPVAANEPQSCTGTAHHEHNPRPHPHGRTAPHRLFGRGATPTRCWELAGHCVRSWRRSHAHPAHHTHTTQPSPRPSATGKGSRATLTSSLAARRSKARRGGTMRRTRRYRYPQRVGCRRHRHTDTHRAAAANQPTNHLQRARREQPWLPSRLATHGHSRRSLARTGTVAPHTRRSRPRCAVPRAAGGADRRPRRLLERRRRDGRGRCVWHGRGRKQELGDRGGLHGAQTKLARW